MKKERSEQLKVRARTIREAKETEAARIAAKLQNMLCDEAMKEYRDAVELFLGDGMADFKPPKAR